MNEEMNEYTMEYDISMSLSLTRNYIKFQNIVMFGN